MAKAVKRALFYVSAVLAGLIGGVCTAAWVMNPSGVAAEIQNGPWGTSDRFGAAKADALTRAIVARVGLFALAKEETIYFTAFTDEDGAALNGACRYRVSGPLPGARWWSITLYGADHYLVESGDGRYSVGASDFAGDLDFQLGPDEPAPGLTSPPGPFSLTMRLYNPAPEVYENLSNTPLPAIVKEGC